MKTPAVSSQQNSKTYGSNRQTNQEKFKLQSSFGRRYIFIHIGNI